LTTIRGKPRSVQGRAASRIRKKGKVPSHLARTQLRQGKEKRAGRKKKKWEEGIQGMETV